MHIGVLVEGLGVVLVAEEWVEAVEDALGGEVIPGTQVLPGAMLTRSLSRSSISRTMNMLKAAP
jgi:uncharacterized protein (DUF2342 family)